MKGIAVRPLSRAAAAVCHGRARGYRVDLNVTGSTMLMMECCFLNIREALGLNLVTCDTWPYSIMSKVDTLHF